ncbi:lysozyme [Ectothiorhodospiraceae bacterium WFHF3C12]|nr:lysozyme [Ectothiorhodospiraceae bacterium WFHF3C12]
MLNSQTFPGEPAPLAEDGIAGPNTIQRIERFQAVVLGFETPDGRVDPGAATLQALQPGTGGDAGEEPASLTPSDEAVDLLKSIEGLRLEPYDDQTGDPVDEWVPGATVGYGHLIGRDEWDRYRDGVSEQQAESLLESDLAPFVQAVQTQVRRRLKQHEFDALVILVFNIGTGAFAASSVLKMLNDPSAETAYDSLEAAWKAWNKSQGRVMEGLVKRREAEWKIFSAGVYERW